MLLPLFSVRLKARKTPTQAPILDPDKMLAAVLIQSSERESSGKPDLTLPLQPQPASSAASVQSLSHPSSRDIMALAPAIGPKGSFSSFLTLETTAEPVLVYSGATASSSPIIPGAAYQISQEQLSAVFRPLPPYQQQPWRLPPLPLLSHFLNGIKLHILQGLFYDIKYTYNLILRSFYIVQVSGIKYIHKVM